MEKKTYDIKGRSYEYALEVVRFLERLPKDYISQTLGKQLLRSATSVGANVIEAQASSSKRDFINFYHHSLKSANESKFWFSLLKGTGNGTSDRAAEFLRETHKLANILASSILTMKGKR